MGMAAVLFSIPLDMDGLPDFVSGSCEVFTPTTVSGPVAPTHKTAGQRPKPRLADETSGGVLGLGAPLGHQLLRHPKRGSHQRIRFSTYGPRW
jgi:hypothetical protein